MIIIKKMLQINPFISNSNIGFLDLFRTST